MKLFNKNTLEFVLNIGDDGAILSLFIEGKLNKRIFASNPYAPEFQSLAGSFPTAPIYILLDTIDQNYIERRIPKLSNPLDVKKIINRNLLNEFDQRDINSYFKNVNDAGSSENKIVFVSVRNASPVADWLEVLNDISNRIMGIYLVPVEAMSFVKRLREVSGYADKKAESPKWEIIVSHNRVSGFRQIVFKNGGMVFTRVSQANGVNSPDVIAGSIEQETSNTIEYIRRIGFNDSDSLNIYIISSKEVGKLLNVTGTLNSQIFKYSPYEIATKSGLENSSQETDKFCDVIYAANFISSPKKLKLLTKELKYQEKLFLTRTYSIYVTLAIAAVLGIISLTMFASYFSDNSGISKAKADIENITKLADSENFEVEFNVKPEVIIEGLQTHKKVSEINDSIYEIIKQLIELNNFKVEARNIQVVTANNERSFDVTFIFKRSDYINYGDMLSTLENFSNAMKTGFADKYDVIVSGMPSDAEFKIDSENKDTEIKLSLKPKQAVGVSKNPIKNFRK